MARSRNIVTVLNLVSGAGVLITNVLISFLLSPYIVRTIGVEANGFVNLANNFIAIADLIVTALNAMTARFITIAYVKQDYEKANLYYNSVFWGNLIVAGALLAPAAAFIIWMEHFINVPANILVDVKILFSMAFAGFLIRTIAPNWDCGTHATNRLDRANVPNIITALFRCLFLLLVFSLWVPHIWYVSLVALLVTILTLLVARYNTHMLTPELKISIFKPICSKKAIRDLVGSGIWSSIAIAGSMLMSNFDLLICNLALGATEMGLLSISRNLYSILNTFSETIRGTFGPELTIAYAKGDKNEILSCMRRSIKITAVVVSVPVAGFIVLGKPLFCLWQPTLDANLLWLLTSLALISFVFCCGINALNSVFVTVNRVKINSYALIIAGAISLGVILLLVNTTEYGLYAIAGVSSIVILIKNMVFMVPVSSKLLGFKWYQFFPQVGTSILSTAVIVGIGWIVKLVVPVNTWVGFFLACVMVGILGLAANLIIVLNKKERKQLLDIAMRKILKK